MQDNARPIGPPGLPGIFVARPLLAMVLNLLIIIAGLAAFNAVEIRELPNVDQPIVSVSAEYTGASPRTVDADVTSVLEDALAQLEGLKSISSSSSYGRSDITLEFSASVDLVNAANETRELVSRAGRDLPTELEDPVVRKNDADADPIMRLALTGDVSLAELSSLAENQISERLTGIDGVAEVQIRGELERIFRVTFYPVQLASRGLSLTDLRSALLEANLDRPLGALETSTQSLLVRSTASATTAEAISRIRLNANTVIGDVAFVQLTSDEPTVISRVNGQPAVVLNVIRQSMGNTLSISTAVRAAIAQIQATLPAEIQLSVASDDGVFIEESLQGVSATILLAFGVVIVVIFAFLRSLRAIAIVAVSVPIALIGAVAALWLAGFSVNTITLLALVLATGMVVDDTIVVLENIVRRRADGLGAYAAAAYGTHEVFFAVVSTTATLAAVFIPISFLPGPAGAIFGEFGFVLAFSVTISSFVALTLCPAMSALLDPGASAARRSHVPGRPATSPEGASAGWLERLISLVIKHRLLVLFAALGFAGLSLQLYQQLPKEITPPEDRGLIVVVLRTPASASLEYTSAQAEQVEQAIDPLIRSGEVQAVQSIVGMRGAKNSAIVLLRLAPWASRDRTQQEIIADVRRPISEIPGAIVALRTPNSLGVRGAGSGLKFAVTGKNYDRLETLADALVERMKTDPVFSNPQLSYDVNQPQLDMDINRELAANLGISPGELISTINTFIEGSDTASLFLDNESVDIKLVVGGRPVDDQTDLENIFIKTPTGQFVPISTIVSLTESAGAATLSRERRQPAVPAQANLGDGVDLGTAAERLRQLATEVLGDEASIVLLGEAATLDESASGSLLVFAAAILIVFLVLSAQFESILSALIIIITVPIGLGAALLAIKLSGGSLNYYSQIGLVMLVGIMAKNGILIVEFANQLREQGAHVDRAIRQAVKLRLRPVLMTMVSTVAGGIPLVLATGAGAEARIAVGWVVVGGLGFATMVTFFLIPALYRIIAPWGQATGSARRQLEHETAAQPNG